MVSESISRASLFLAQMHDGRRCFMGAHRPSEPRLSWVGGKDGQLPGTASMIETESPETGIMRRHSNPEPVSEAFHSVAVRSLPPVTARSPSEN